MPKQRLISLASQKAHKLPARMVAVVAAWPWPYFPGLKLEITEGNGTSVPAAQLTKGAGWRRLRRGRLNVWRVSYEAHSPDRLRLRLVVQEQVPFGDAVRVAKQQSNGELLRRARDADELQTGFVRQTVPLA